MELPAGLTHPFETVGLKATTYRHGMTFTWTRGEPYVAVQRGRVANCSRVRVMHDAYPGVDILLGRQPIVDWMPAPRRPVEWRKPEIMVQLADQWHETQRARMRRSA